MIFDYIILIMLIVFLINGWCKGLFRSLIGPAVFLFFTLMGIINYDLDQNLIKALSIVAIGTLSSIIIIWLFWAISRRYVPVQERYYLFWGSRLLGAAIGFVWEGFVLAVVLVLLTTLPNSFVGPRVKIMIKESRSYTAINQHLLQRIPYIQQLAEFVAVIADPAWLESVKSSQEYQEFIAHPKIQNVLNDAQIMAEINNQDFIKLLANPKITDVLKDAPLMRQFTHLTKMAVKNQASTNAPPSFSVSQ